MSILNQGYTSENPIYTSMYFFIFYFGLHQCFIIERLQNTIVTNILKFFLDLG